MLGMATSPRKEARIPMEETGLKGPFSLTATEIGSQVTEKSAGVYLLDRSHESGPFYISYVGRSDTDVKGRLQEHVGKYKRFKFEYHASPLETFEKECALYHDFNPPSTISHPGRQSSLKWKCPRCKVFG